VDVIGFRDSAKFVLNRKLLLREVNRSTGLSVIFTSAKT
jgi:hypothetical protein